MEGMTSAQLLRLAIGSAAVCILLGSGAGLTRFFRERGLPWTCLALFAAALFAAFVLTLALSVPILARLNSALAGHAPGVHPILVRLASFVPVCGAISFFCLRALSHTRFLGFLPDKLIRNAALLVTAGLLLFALTGA